MSFVVTFVTYTRVHTHFMMVSYLYVYNVYTYKIPSINTVNPIRVDFIVFSLILTLSLYSYKNLEHKILKTFELKSLG